jgi:hypothetical protein
MSQSRRQSLIEALVGTAIGYVVALGGQLVIFPILGIYVPLMENILIGAIFTSLSLVRAYAVRRMFNWFR